MLVACSKEEIGDYIENYPETDETVERLGINMYIIVDEASPNAMISVKDRISGYTKTKYDTVLNVNYVTADVYEKTVMDAIAAGGDATPNIVLINSEGMMNSLVYAEGGNKLADLTPYYNSRDYGRMNSQITASLIQSSKIDGKLYTVPNNHVVDQYTYLVVNKQVAHKELHITTTEIESYKSIADASALIDKMNAAGYEASKYVYEVNGPYELKAALESQGNFCNVIKQPTVTKAEAFSSAFAIVNNANSKYNDRAMQMIYAINNDFELRNLLQYGVEGANYIVENDRDNDADNDNIVRKKDENNIYSMNLSYTGNVFNANYCSEIGWTKIAKENGTKQNKDSLSAQ